MAHTALRAALTGVGAPLTLVLLMPELPLNCRWMSSLFAGSALAGSLLAGGCLVVADDLDPEARSTLVCEGSASVSIEIEAEAETLTNDFEDSLMEMLVCGQLSVELVDGVQSGVWRAIIDGRSDATPEGWVHQDDGTYLTGSATTDMTSAFHLSRDTSFGAKGDRIEANVFRVDSYLDNPRVVISTDSLLSGKGELHFDAAGPLVELLGFGAEPSSPIAVDVGDAAKLASKLDDLEFRSDIHYVDADGETTIMYDVQTRPLPASALLLGEALQYEVEAITATRGEMTLDVTTWAMDFRDEQGISGQVDVRVDVQADLECRRELVFQDVVASGD